MPSPHPPSSRCRWPIPFRMARPALLAGLGSLALALLIGMAGAGAQSGSDTGSTTPGADTGAGTTESTVGGTANSVGGAAAPTADDELLRAGSEVYTAVCSSCHQPGGAGLAGRYPPLQGNPNVADAAYVADVIRNGRQGELTVNGATFNGVMPAQSTLTDADVEAVIAFIQGGFRLPAGAVAEPSGPVAGTKLPMLSNYSIFAAFAVAAAGFALVLGPRVIAANDRRTIGWTDAWLKTAVIVIGMIAVTTLVPAWVLENGTVQRLSRPVQELITLALWTGGLGAGLAALWYAHRQDRL
ncbi:MAG: cytochrome c [Acidimicrobiia bacterium]